MYFGITKNNPLARWANGKGYRNQTVFWRAIQKYGWENFNHIILYTNLSKEEAKNIEISLIAQYKTNCNKYKNPTYGYNATDGGDSTNVRPLTEKEKQQHRESARLTRAKHIDCFDLQGCYIATYRGFTEAAEHTGAARENIFKCCSQKIKSAAGYMFKYSNHTKSSISPYTKYQPNNTKQINQYNLDGTFIRSYTSISEAAKAVNVDVSCICACASGKTSVCVGYIWTYDKNPPLKIPARNTSPTYPKRVAQLSLDGDLIAEYDSIADAKRAVGKPDGRNINSVLAGRRNKAYGYIWKYI